MITFVPPTVVTIEPGDTVEDLARKHGVPVDLLMAWNGLQPGDALTPGRTMLVFDLDEAPTIASVDAAKNPSGPAAAAAPKQRRARAANKAPVLKVEPTVLVAPQEETRPAPGKGVKIALPEAGRVGQAGVLGSIDGMEMGSGSDALVDAANGLEGRRASDGGVGLRDNNSLAAGGSAENMDHVANTKVVGNQTLGPHGTVSVKAPVLPRAAPKTCLKTTTTAYSSSDDNEMITVGGLTADQVRSGMGKVVRYTMQCIPRGTIGSFTVTVEVTVGCNGLVTDVWMANTGGMPTPVTNCISQTVAQASFAAHALPDGAVFEYPITYRF